MTFENSHSLVCFVCYKHRLFPQKLAVLPWLSPCFLELARSSAKRATGQHLSSQNCFYPSDIAIPQPCVLAHVWLCVRINVQVFGKCVSKFICTCMLFLLEWKNTCLCAWVGLLVWHICVANPVHKAAWIQGCCDFVPGQHMQYFLPSITLYVTNKSQRIANSFVYC